MSLTHIEALFEHDENTPEPPEREQIREAITLLQEDYESRGIELVEVASGWRLQSRQEMSPWIANLFQEKAPRYSRALLETLVLVAYRQPITRSEIEDVRGVAVSANIVKTLIERDWVKVVGHRDVPGRPELLGTTKQFLDYFNLRKIGDLPTLSEIKSLDEIAPDLARAATDETDENSEAEAKVDQSRAAEVDGDDHDHDLSAADSSGAAASDVDESGGDVDLSASQVVEEGAALAESDDSDNDEQALPVVDVELSLDEDENEGENAGEEASQNAASEDNNTAEENDDGDEDSVSVAEATIDAMANVARPETELLH